LKTHTAFFSENEVDDISSALDHSFRREF